MKLTPTGLLPLRIYFTHNPSKGSSAHAIVGQDVEPSYLGLSHLSALDTFNRAKGRRVSLRRLLEAMRLSTDQRAEIWEEYFRVHSDLRRRAARISPPKGATA